MAKAYLITVDDTGFECSEDVVYVQISETDKLIAEDDLQDLPWSEAIPYTFDYDAWLDFKNTHHFEPDVELDGLEKGQILLVVEKQTFYDVTRLFEEYAENEKRWTSEK